jgi:hypothetical protein
MNFLTAEGALVEIDDLSFLLVGRAMVLFHEFDAHLVTLRTSP